MLWILIKKQLTELFQSYFVDAKTGKEKSKAKKLMTCVGAVLLFGLVGLSFFMFMKETCSDLVSSGHTWLFLALSALISMALGVFASVFNTYASMYLPKDNEALLSLPISPMTLVLSRSAGVYAVGLLFFAWLWIPSVLAYLVLTSVTVMKIVSSVVLTFILPLVVYVLSCILGLAVAYISTKAKGKSYISVIMSLSFLALYYVVYFKLVNELQNIGFMMDSISEKVIDKLYLIYIVGRAGEGDLLSLGIISLINIAVTALCILILSRTVFSLILKAKDVPSSKGKAARNDTRPKSIPRALFDRELRHFTSLATWMLNGGLGVVIAFVLAVAALIKGSFVSQMLLVISQEIPILGENLPVLVFMAVSMIICVNTILSISISIERNQMWIIKSLPLDMKDVLKAKLRMGFVLNAVPALMLSAVLCILGSFHPVVTVLVCINVCAFIYILQLSDLTLDILHPNFTWTNIAYLSKQSLNAVISLFGSIILCLLGGGCAFLLNQIMPIWTALLVILSVYLIICIVFRTYVLSKGARLMESF